MGDDKTSKNASRAIYPAESAAEESVSVSSSQLVELATKASALTGAIGKLSSKIVTTNPSIGNDVWLPNGFLMQALAPREREVLSLMACGYNNSAIAEKLVVSRKTVENYINRIYHTLNLVQDYHVYPRVGAVLHYIFYIVSLRR